MIHNRPAPRGGYLTEGETIIRDLLYYAWLGTRGICPACRRGHMYRNLFSLHEACPVCGVVFEREEGDFLGAMVLAYSGTAVLLCVLIPIVAVLTPLSFVHHVILWSVLAGLFLVFSYRNWKGAWTGILHAMNGLRAR